MTPTTHTKNQKNLNNKQGTEKEHRAEGTECSPHELSVNKDWNGRRANSGQVISYCLKLRQIVVHKAHILSQEVISKVKQH
jgi:hypothetical protein